MYPFTNIRIFRLDQWYTPRDADPAMPLHFYAPVHLPCRLCVDGFEQYVGPSDPSLTACPTCGQAVQRQGLQSINTPKLSASATVSIAKQAGFAVLKRTGDGHFEKQ